ncbi:hypothetical protein ABW19_dt0204897 [Dactylella cylindrospora]|nr:hypothetical protein ABW19_dt0204897 [Dactylella cylindrospora]
MDPKQAPPKNQSLLEKHNYLLWSRNMKLRLRALGWWTIIEGTWTKPGTDAPPAEIEKWVTADAKALLLIHHECSTQNQVIIHECQTSKEAWDLLSLIYISAKQTWPGPARVARYSHVHPDECASDYVVRMIKSRTELMLAGPGALGSLKQDQNLITEIMRGMGNRWPHIVEQGQGNLQYRKDRYTIYEFLSDVLRFEEEEFPYQESEEDTYRAKDGKLRFYYSGNTAENPE